MIAQYSPARRGNKNKFIQPKLPGELAGNTATTTPKALRSSLRFCPGPISSKWWLIPTVAKEIAHPKSSMPF